MEFMNGVIPIKEIMSLSISAMFIFVGIELIAIAMSFGGIALHIKGRRYFSIWRKNVGTIISFGGIIILLFLLGSYKSNLIIPFAEELGLTDHTGKYEVIVTDDADMNEFQDCYEIIDCENGVYTIKVKEN